jgi:epoxyqueuosine reductase
MGNALRQGEARWPTGEVSGAVSGEASGRHAGTGTGTGTGTTRPLAPDERESIVAALRARADDPSPLVREHVQWALQAA